MYYLYRHIRLDKNEPFYIGIGKKYAYSRIEYCRAKIKAKRNSIWNKIVSKTKYKIEILFESDDESVIKQKEVEFIKLYGRIDLGTGTLANMSNGNDANFNLSPIIKKQISERMKGNKLGSSQIWDKERRNKSRQLLLGNTFFLNKRHKEESKNKISIALSGRKQSEKQRQSTIGVRKTQKKIICLNNNITYNSIQDCVRKLFKCDVIATDNKFRNYKHQISFVCNGRKESYKGYKFKFL